MTTQNEQLIQANFKLRARQIDALDELKEKTGVPKAEIIRRAIDAYLKQPEIGLYLEYGRTPLPDHDKLLRRVKAANKEGENDLETI